MGEQMNKIIDEYQWNSAQPDYSLVTENNEGFYLHYSKDVWTDGDRFSIHAYVTSEGIVSLQIRDLYIQGDVYQTPEALVSADTVLAQLPGEVENSRFPSTVKSIQSISLIYTPMRASHKEDGIVLAPAWLVIYQDEDAARSGFTCWAVFDAVNGTLLSAIFK